MLYPLSYGTSFAGLSLRALGLSLPGLTGQSSNACSVIMGARVAGFRFRGSDKVMGRQRDESDEELWKRLARSAKPLATGRPPALRIGIPPAAVTQMRHAPHVRSGAMLAPRTGPVEPDGHRELPPVDRVEPAVLRADRHDDFMSHLTGKRKRIIRRLLPLRIFFVPLRTPRGKAGHQPGSGRSKRLQCRTW